MAVKKTIELDVNTKAGLQAVNELGLSFEEAFTEADNLSGQIGELEDALYAMASAGDTSSREYKELSEQIGIYKKVIIDTDMQVDALSQTTAQKMGGALSGVTSGFELSAGAMGAMGANSEDVEAALLKVQSAMAISQGIDGIRQSIPAFKAMKTAIMSNVVVQKLLNFVMNLNPIGIIIAGVVALGAAIAALGSPLKMFNKLFGEQTEAVLSAKDAQEQLTEAIEKTDSAIEKINKKRNKDQAQKMEQMVADGATEKELHEERLNVLKTEQKARSLQIKIEREELAQLRANKSKAVAEGETELAEEIREQIIAKKKSFEDLKELQTNFNHDISIENKDARAKEKAAEEADYNERVGKYKEYLAKKKEAEDTQLAVLRELEQGRIDLLAEGFEKENEQIRNKYKIQREDLLANESLTASQKAELQLLHDVQEAEALKKVKETQLQAEIEAENTKQDALAEMLLQRGAEIPVEEMPEVIAEDIKGQAIFDIKEKWNQKAEKMRSITDSKIWKATEKGMNDSMTALTAIDDLNTMLTDAAVAKAGSNEQAAEKARKKGFERSKKLQLAMAVITGIQGVMAAFTAGSSMGPAGMVMGPLMAGLAAVGAAVNVSKIAKTKYEGGGASVSAATGSTAPPSVPSFNIAGNSTENQLATSLGSQEQQPIKAMVVSTEVTTAQSLDRNKVETASL